MTTKLALVYLAICAALPALGASTATVSATAGPNSCSQSNPFVVNCSVNQAGVSQTATASGVANATWAPDGTGFLEATANDFGPNTTSFASVFWSLPLMVTGASGSGNLQVTFNGFQMNITTTPGSASVTPGVFTLGAFTTNLTLPNGGPANFSATAPITFNSLTTFSFAFQATASGTFFNNGTYAFDGADGKVLFPTFLVTNASGAVIPGATVQFAPEPASCLLALLGTGGIWFSLWVRRRLRA